jgi:hypothetical protein
MALFGSDWLEGYDSLCQLHPPKGGCLTLPR